jgi:hypothetical protein
MGNGVTNACVLNFDTRGEWPVSKPRPLYPQGNSSRYPLNGRPGGQRNRFVRYGQEMSLDPAASTETVLMSRPWPSSIELSSKQQQ